jgi:hypothetical protein
MIELRLNESNSTIITVKGGYFQQKEKRERKKRIKCIE